MRLALLKDINNRVAAPAGLPADDMLITLYEAPGEDFSFAGARRSALAPYRGKMLPQRAFADRTEENDSASTFRGTLEVVLSYVGTRSLAPREGDGFFRRCRLALGGCT
jgi:hypothetical protein